MIIDKNAVAKTGMKLNSFKKLISHTLVLTTYSLPSLIYLQMYPAVDNVIMAADFFIGVIGIVGITALFGTSLVPPLNSKFWQNLFNLPFISLLKNQNEKTILKSRRLMDQSSFSPKDYDWLAKNLLLSVSSSTYKQFEEMLGHQIYNEKNRNKGLGIKDRAMINSLSDLEAYMNALDPNALTTAKENLALQVPVSLNLKPVLKVNLISKRRHSITDEDYETFESIKEVVGNKHFKGLTPTNYEDFASIVKTENIPIITSILQYLKPLSHPLIDWDKIKETIKTHYKTSNLEYKSWISSIDELINAEKAQKKNAAIAQQISSLSGIEENASQALASKTKEVNSITPASPPTSLQELTNPPLDATKWCDFVEYDSTIYADKWFDIKTMYTKLFKMQANLEKVDLIELNSHLKTVLPILISVDMSIKASNIVYPQGAKELAGQNLDMIIIKLHDLTKKMESNLSRELEVVTRYQENKVMKMGKS